MIDIGVVFVAGVVLSCVELCRVELHQELQLVVLGNVVVLKLLWELWYLLSCLLLCQELC